MGLKALLEQILAELLSSHNQPLVQAIQDLKTSVDADTATLAALKTSVDSVAEFIGAPVVGAVSTAQVQETLGKLQSTRALVGNFNP